MSASTLLATGIGTPHVRVRFDGTCIRRHRAESRRLGARLHAQGVERQDVQGLRLPEQPGDRAGLVPEAYTRGCTIECKSLAEHGDLIRQYDVAYFMISVDPLDENTAFTESQHADFPLLRDQLVRRCGNSLRRRSRLERRMKETDRHGPLADRRRAAFDRSAANIAGGEPPEDSPRGKTASALARARDRRAKHRE